MSATTVSRPITVTVQDVPDNLETADSGMEYLRQGLEGAFANGAILKLEDAVRQVDDHPR